MENEHHLSLEGFEATLTQLEQNFHNKDMHDYKSLEVFRDILVDELCASIGSVTVISLRKIFSTNNYILWLILKVHDKFVYAVIFNLIWFDDRKGLNMFKKMEEVDLSWVQIHNTKSLSEFEEILKSNDKYDYSLAMGTEMEKELPQFEKAISKVSETYREKHRGKQKQSKSHVDRDQIQRKYRDHHPKKRDRYIPRRRLDYHNYHRKNNYKLHNKRRNHPYYEHRDICSRCHKHRRDYHEEDIFGHRKHRRRPKHRGHLERRGHRRDHQECKESRVVYDPDYLDLEDDLGQKYREQKKEETEDQRWNKLLLAKKSKHL